MNTNQRIFIRQKARNQLASFFLEIVKENNLTFGEIFSILLDEQRQWSGYLLKEEDKEKSIDHPERNEQ